MKKLLAALLVMLGINAMADDINLWQKSTLNSIVQKGVLTVGLEPGYMPFEMKDKQGNIIGFDVDMANEMAKAVAPVRGMASKGPMHKIMALIISMAGIPPSLCNSPSLLSMQFDASMA